MSRRDGGSVRRLPSGRWQVRVRDRATGRLVPLGTYAAKGDATIALARAVADQSRGAWIDPRRSALTLAEYAQRWLAQHPRLAPRTRELYDGLLARHVLPDLGPARLGDLTPAGVRRWHAALGERTGPSTVAKSYRLLRTILSTAVADELLTRNPCAVKGAGLERPAERPTATIPQVYALADAVEARYRALVLLGAFTGLRFGELAGLRRRDVDQLHGTVRVSRQLQRLADRTDVVLEPKSEAGRRTVSVPPQVLDVLGRHLIEHSAEGLDALVFARPDGRPLDRHYWGQVWRRVRLVVARTDASLPEGLRFHDLRHTGNTLAAATGASTRELMARMGHASPRAALIYQHATRDRDEVIAAALGDLIGRSGVAPIVDLDARREARP